MPDTATAVARHSDGHSNGHINGHRPNSGVCGATAADTTAVMATATALATAIEVAEATDTASAATTDNNSRSDGHSDCAASRSQSINDRIYRSNVHRVAVTATAAHSGGQGNRHSSTASAINTAIATVTATSRSQSINNGFYCRVQTKSERKVYMSG